MKRIYLAVAAVLIMLIMVPSGSSAQVPVNSLMKVTGVSWYGVNSSSTVAAGDSYAPLYVSFINGFGTVTDLNVSVNLNGSSVFSYSHVTGSGSLITENIPLSGAGDAYVIVQPLNISSTASTGIYTLFLHYTFTMNTTEYAGNTSFLVPLMGTVNLVGTQSFFGTQATPLIGTPGMRNVPLTVIVENTGNSYAENISVSYSPAGPFEGVTQNTYISAVQPFGYSVLTFTVTIPYGVSDGMYSQALSVSYNGINRSVQFSVPVTGYSKISMVTYYTNPPVLYKGMRFIQLTSVFANSGNSFASNLNISATSQSFGIVSGKYSIPYLPSGGIFNATFLLNAPSAAGNSSISISAGNVTYTLYFNVRPSGELSVTSSIPAMTPGQSQALETFVVKNTGTSSIYDLSIYLISPGIISVHVSSSNPLSALTANNFTIGKLNPGQSFTVTFVVDVSSSAVSGTYQSQLFMTYMMNESAMKFTHAYDFQNTVKPTTVQSFENFVSISIEEFIVLIVIIVVVVAVVSLAVRSRKKKR